SLSSIDQPTRKRWGGVLLPLMREIVQVGAAGDVSALFQQLHEGLYADIFPASAMFDLVGLHCSRFVTENLRSDSSAPKWSEVANYAAESLEVLQSKGLLLELTLRNTAYDLLTKLGSAAVGSSKAPGILTRMQAADE